MHYNATSDLRLPGISGQAKWFGSEFSAAKTIIAVGLNGEIILGYNTCSSQGNMKVRITLFSATEEEELKLRLYRVAQKKRPITIGLITALVIDIFA